MRALWLPAVILAGFAVPARADLPARPAAQPVAQDPAAQAPATVSPAPVTRVTYRPRRPPPGPQVADPVATDLSDLPVAFGVNLPLGWPSGAFGASVYVGLGGRYALRGNFAWYENKDPLGDLAAGLEDGDTGLNSGSIHDLGLSWIWYSRDLWQGFLFEAGALRRARDIGEFDDVGAKIETVSTTYAGRAMIGWSWLIARRVFIAAAVGVSVGRETGRETFISDLPDVMPSTSAVNRVQVDGEAYLRLGLAFGR